MRYLAITPVRDEADFLPPLIDSMIRQTIQPASWIIIDDGSSDNSSLIIRLAAQEHSWIQPHYLARNGRRKAGGESIIMRFLPPAVWQLYDFIARFDADLSFGPNYIEALLNEFYKDPTLGIASGTLFEPGRKGWRERITPEHHARGPSKLYSSVCFGAIGGLEEGLGWDTIDEVRAMMTGFRTRSFRHIPAYHRRSPGSALGLCRGRLDDGRAAFAAGYSPTFMLARSLVHIGSPPCMIGGVLMFAGYLGCLLRGERRLADKELTQFIRRQQRRRLLTGLSAGLILLKTRFESWPGLGRSDGVIPDSER